MRIVLASKSPRRREILSMLGVTFDIVTADTDEHSTITNPAALVEELALRKGRAVKELLLARGKWNDDTLIIASDTVVATGNVILGKPEDELKIGDVVNVKITAIDEENHKVSLSIRALLNDLKNAAAEDAEGTEEAPAGEDAE